MREYEVRFRVIDFNLLCGIEGVTLNEPTKPLKELVVARRGIPFFSLSVLKGEIKGRQRTLELSMEYALAALRRPG